MSTSVYRYYDNQGQLLYVGVTDRGVRRLHEHADSKPWWALAASCEVEHFETRDQALAEEKRLIKVLRPLYNEQHHPDRTLSVSERALLRDSAMRDVATQRVALTRATLKGGPSGALEEWDAILKVAEKHGRSRLSRGEVLRAAQAAYLCATEGAA